MSDSILDPRRLVKTVEKITQAERNRNLNDQASKASIDPSYAGGPPAIVEAGATGAYLHSIVRPYFWAFPTASEDVVKQPIGDADVLLGNPFDIPSGVIYNSGAYKLLPKDYPESDTTVNSASATNVRGMRILIPAPLLVAKIDFEVVAATAGAIAAIGIYSSDRGHLLIDTGAVSVATNGIKEVTLGTPYLLQPGWYWYMFTITDSAVTLRAIAMASNVNNLLNQGTVQRGQAANAASAGVLPATLGAITGQNFNMPFCKLQGA